MKIEEEGRRKERKKELKLVASYSQRKTII